jgi:hypothetical protein
MSEHRCDSYGVIEIIDDEPFLKRCIRAKNHDDGEKHVWVEADNVDGRAPFTVYWTEAEGRRLNKPPSYLIRNGKLELYMEDN